MNTTWQDRIQELKASGMNYASMARSLNVHPSTITDIAYGRTKEPKGDLAVNLHSLHKRVMARIRRQQQ